MKTKRNFINLLTIASILLAQVFTVLGVIPALAASAWQNVGAAGFSAGGAGWNTLGFYNGTPYVVYEDGTQAGKASMQKFDGTNWVYVGSAGFTGGGESSYLPLAFNSTGEPYVAYRDGNAGYKASVMKFNGTNWVYVGSQGASPGSAYCVDLAIDSNIPYMSFNDYNTNRVVVMSFNGTVWGYVGSSTFTGLNSCTNSIAFNNNGVLYIAYS